METITLVFGALQTLGNQMVKRLQAFAQMSQMRKMAMVLLARTFTDKDVKHLKVGF